MGEAELIPSSKTLIIRSVIYCYGDAASPEIADQIARDIRQNWNEPEATVTIHHSTYTVRFDISGIFEKELKPETVWYNDDPRLNFFRIEEYAQGNISFVDGCPCNTGYFKLDNLLQTSTTAAHEYGHTIGLNHPDHLDVRGTLTPGIMYPRGTLCDPPLQYDPTAQPAAYGGFLNPVHRKVRQEDVDLLKLHKLHFNSNGYATVGGFSSIYHEKHIPSDFQ